MLSYRHIYHAGNHADILKHLTVSQIGLHLAKKEAPYFYLDTHAGIGLYKLSSEQAMKNREFDSGITKLLNTPSAELPTAINDFLDIVRSYNEEENLQVYPGSPKVIEYYTRLKDKMHLCELHPNDHPVLQSHFPNKRRANVVNSDGFEAVKAMLPPPQKRGLVLMDPPYEVKKDYQKVVEALQDGYRRFSGGTYAIWYPVLTREQADSLLNAVKNTNIRKVLLLELLVKAPDSDRGMKGSGMIVVNPPWTLASEAKEWMPVLVDLLGESDQASYQVRWITPE